MPRENSFSDEGRSVTPDIDAFGPEDDDLRADLPSRDATLIERGQPRPKVTLREGAALALARSRSPGGASAAARSPIALQPTTRGAARFRATVRKVMHMHRTSSIITSFGGAGAEPGVDPSTARAHAQFSHLRERCAIEVIDYSSVHHSFKKLNNEEFVNLMRHSGGTAGRESWSKVRWINIGGISWDVISALAIQYNLHPLTLEDVLHQPRGGLLSKTDYFVRHLFIRVLCHALVDGSDEPANEHDLYADPAKNLSYENLPQRTSSPEPMMDEKSMPGGHIAVEVGANARSLPYRQATTASEASDMQRAAKDAFALDYLKRGHRIDVAIRPMCMWLLRDGTVISVRSSPSLEYTAPIRERLRSRDTGLRTTPDPSLLVHALLDLVVDRTFAIADAFQRRIVHLEHAVLLKPKMSVVRELHIVQADLAQHRRTLEPIKTVVYGLRRYDMDRVAALYPDTDRENRPKGYMTHKANIYLADVVDHIDYVLSSLENYGNITENLINYTFNMASYQMNEVMKRLTLATIIFLPLTLLSGYFGMNFDGMWSIHNQTDVFFWEIAIPLVIVVCMIFMWSDFRDMVHYLKKRVSEKRAVRSAGLAPPKGKHHKFKTS